LFTDTFRADTSTGRAATPSEWKEPPQARTCKKALFAKAFFYFDTKQAIKMSLSQKQTLHFKVLRKGFPTTQL